MESYYVCEMLNIRLFLSLYLQASYEMYKNLHHLKISYNTVSYMEFRECCRSHNHLINCISRSAILSKHVMIV